MNLNLCELKDDKINIIDSLDYYQSGKEQCIKNKCTRYERRQLCQYDPFWKRQWIRCYQIGSQSDGGGRTGRSCD